MNPTTLALYILVNKKPVREPNLLKWAKWMEETNGKVGETMVKGHVISTVFLGMDHNWFGTSPILFETMVFPEGDIQERYRTWEEAEAGHRKIVNKLMGLRGGK